jgi:hypothetical protein
MRTSENDNTYTMVCTLCPFLLRLIFLLDLLPHPPPFPPLRAVEAALGSGDAKSNSNPTSSAAAQNSTALLGAASRAYDRGKHATAAALYQEVSIYSSWLFNVFFYIYSIFVKINGLEMS